MSYDRCVDQVRPWSARDGSRAQNRLSYFYKFEGASPFYLVIAGFGGRKTFLYLPMIELVIYIGDRRFNWTEAPDQVDHFRAFALANLLDAYDYFGRTTQKSSVDRQL